MSRYIDAEAFLVDESEAYISAQHEIQDEATSIVNMIVHKKIQMLIADTPTADAVEVKHGKWELDNDGYYRCTYCNARARWTYDRARQDLNVNYCCNCGVKMRRALNDNG